MSKRHLTFCLCPSLPLFVLASAIEILRHANRLGAGESYYQWGFLTEQDSGVAGSNGMLLQPTSAIDTAADYFVSAWFVPLEVIQKAKAAVIHFNGGFNVGAEDDKRDDDSLDGLMMRVSQSFFFPPFRNFEKIHSLPLISH